MRQFIIAVAAVCIALVLLGIGRELHSIHYEMVLGNCLRMAEHGMKCDPAKRLSERKRGR